MRGFSFLLLLVLPDVHWADTEVYRIAQEKTTQEILSVKQKLEEQTSLTSLLTAQLTSIQNDQLKNKEDISSLNYKTVSLYNELSEQIEKLSTKLTGLEEAHNKANIEMNQKVINLEIHIANIENKAVEENPKFDELDKKVEDVKESMRKKSIDIYSVINSLKGNLNAGKYALSSSLDETNSKIDKHLKSAVSLESMSLKTLETLSTLESKTNRSAGLQEELSDFRLLVARDTAKLRFEEGNWVVIQQRRDVGNPTDFFQRTFDEYTQGFGDPNREFWLGLDRISSLTSGGAVLQIQLETWQGEVFKGEYGDFRVGGGPEFVLAVSGFAGNIGDCLRIANGMKFSTLDVDQDSWHGSCSDRRGRGGWWFNGCGLDNLNGKNLGPGGSGYDGILWFLQDKSTKSFKASTMMIKKIE